MSAHCAAGPRPLDTIRLRRIFGIGDASPRCRRRLGRAFALKPAEEASSSRSQSAAAVPDIDAPSRTVRPPFRLFDPFSARLLRFQPDGSSKAPVRTSVATEFNPGEQRYHTINLLFQSIGNSAARGKRGDGRGEAPSQHLCDLCVLCGKNTLRPRAHLLHPPKLQNTPQRKQ